MRTAEELLLQPRRNEHTIPINIIIITHVFDPRLFYVQATALKGGA